MEEGYYDEEASAEEVKRNKRRKYEPDDQLYNRYTEVFTKESKKKQVDKDSIFTSGGLLEIMDMRNRLVILNLDNYVYFSSENLQTLKDNQTFKDLALKQGTEICFRITEPCLETFVPKVSEPKIGTI